MERLSDPGRQILREALGEFYNPDTLTDLNRDWAGRRVEWLHKLGLDPKNSEHWLMTTQELSELDRQQDSVRWYGQPDATRDEINLAANTFELMRDLTELTGEDYVSKFFK